jgi:hypothetical protein
VRCRLSILKEIAEEELPLEENLAFAIYRQDYAP